MSVQDVLSVISNKQSDACALKLFAAEKEKLSWSFKHLAEQSEYCCKVLQAAGAEKGDSVLLVCGDTPQFFAIFFASLQLGLSLVPLHVDQDELALRRIVNKFTPRLILLEKDLDSSFISSSILQSSSLLYVSTRPANWLKCCSLAEQRGSNKNASCKDAQIVFHSSGSTGIPKSIFYSKSHLQKFLYWQQVLFLSFKDRAGLYEEGSLSPRVNVLPLQHWGGLSFCLQALAEGRCVCLLNDFDAHSLLQVVNAQRCQLLMLIPSMYEALMQQLNTGPKPKALQYCLTMGEAMSESLSTRLYQTAGIKLYVAYGMSEALSGLAHGDEGWQNIPRGSCGRQHFGKIKLVNEAGAEEAYEGEMWVKNATTIPCYQDAELLQNKYDKGWYKTGDRFYRDEQGYFFFKGRIDGMCVHNGRNVYPEMLESVFIQHHDVQGCVASSILTKNGTSRLATYIQMSSEADLSTTELMDYYLEHGAQYAAPVYLLCSHTLPRNVTSKPDRTAIKQLLQQGYDDELEVQQAIGDTC